MGDVCPALGGPVSHLQESPALTCLLPVQKSSVVRCRVSAPILSTVCSLVVWPFHATKCIYCCLSFVLACSLARSLACLFLSKPTKAPRVQTHFRMRAGSVCWIPVICDIAVWLHGHPLPALPFATPSPAGVQAGGFDCRLCCLVSQLCVCPCGCGSKPIVPFWGWCTTHFSLF